MGNNDNSKMSQIASALIVGPLWQKFMIEILKDIPDESFKPADPIDPTNLKPVLKGIWQSENGPHEILYYVDKEDPQGPYPRNPASDPEFSLWEAGVQNWAFTTNYQPIQPIVSTSTATTTGQ